MLSGNVIYQHEQAFHIVAAEMIVSSLVCPGHAMLLHRKRMLSWAHGRAANMATLHALLGTRSY